MSEFRLARLTWPEVERLVPETAAVLLPVGSTEQHGHHVPLDNDIFTSRVLAERAAEAAAAQGLTVRYDASCQESGLGVAMDYLRDITPSGVVGDATRATRETGVAIRDVAVSRLVEAIAELARSAPVGPAAPAAGAAHR